MIRTFLTVAALSAVIALSPMAFARQTVGTPVEAKAMLERAVVAVKENKVKAIELFNKGEGGFLDRDLYVFCNNLDDGKFVATGNSNGKQLIGHDVRTLKDGAGKLYGLELFAGEHEPEGKITEVRYVFPRPGSKRTLVRKISLVTRAGDLGCGVGYYNQ